MIRILNELYSKLVKKSPPEEEEDEDEDQAINVVAFFNLAVNDKDELIISSDFLDGHEDEMSKLVFLLCSGTLMEVVNNIVSQRCGENEKLRDHILANAYSMMMKNLEKLSEDDDDSDEPVVDPCFVFKPKNTGEDDDEDDD